MKKILIILSVAFLAAANLTAVIFNTNILINGDAEAGTGSPDGDAIVSVPGWTTVSNFNVNAFGSASDTIPASTPGPANHGANFFAGGPNTQVSSTTQITNISSVSAMIDRGSVKAVLSGWLGGWSTQDDNAKLTASFYDATTNTLLGQVSIGPVLAVDRTNITCFLFRSATNAIPSGTRVIVTSLLMTRLSGSYNDGYADNLSLVLLSSPTLNISNSASGAVLSWPTNYTGFQLQTANSPKSPVSWTLATNLIGVSGGLFITTNQIGTGPQYFRLYAP